jgi:6-phosphogluconolactonase
MSHLPIFAVALLSLTQLAPAADLLVYFGTQRIAPDAGISVARFNPDTGLLSPPKLLLSADGPSFFALSPDGHHLYSTNYTADGGVSAYALDPATGNLTLLNRIPGNHFGTSHISLDQSGRFALAANFDHGQIAVFPIAPDGSLAAPVFTDHHPGSGPNPARQKTTYPHCILTDPSNHYALIPDLGLDKLFVYQFNNQTGKLTPNDPPYLPITPGSGPRHLRFHPNNQWLYLVSEMASTIDTFSWDSATGRAAPLQKISMLSPDFQKNSPTESTAAEIVIHPSGKFLYASNRGEDTIVAFAIDPRTGKLTTIARTPSQGKTPRDFVLDPTGNWLICTNQASNNAAVFQVDTTTGKLSPFGPTVEVPAPCGLILANN